MTVNALIAKAMSTNSEEEAIASLRMARKKNKGKTFTFDGSQAETDWEKKAREFHCVALKWKSHAEDLQSQLNLVDKDRKYYYTEAHKYYNKWKDKEPRTITNTKDYSFCRTSFIALLAINILSLVISGLLQ